MKLHEGKTLDLFFSSKLSLGKGGGLLGTFNPDSDLLCFFYHEVLEKCTKKGEGWVVGKFEILKKFWKKMQYNIPNSEG